MVIIFGGLVQQLARAIEQVVRSEQVSTVLTITYACMHTRRHE